MISHQRISTLAGSIFFWTSIHWSLPGFDAAERREEKRREMFVPFFPFFDVPFGVLFFVDASKTTLIGVMSKETWISRNEEKAKWRAMVEYFSLLIGIFFSMSFSFFSDQFGIYEDFLRRWKTLRGEKAICFNRLLRSEFHRCYLNIDRRMKMKQWKW